MPNVVCLGPHFASNSLPFHVRVGHNPSEETNPCSDRQMPRCEAFLMLNYHGDVPHDVFGWFGVCVRDAPRRQEDTCYPPPPQSVRLFGCTCLSGLSPEVSFNARGRTGGAPLAPSPIWKRGPVAPGRGGRGAWLGSAGQAQPLC